MCDLNLHSIKAVRLHNISPCFSNFAQQTPQRIPAKDKRKTCSCPPISDFISCLPSTLHPTLHQQNALDAPKHAPPAIPRTARSARAAAVLSVLTSWSVRGRLPSCATGTPSACGGCGHRHALAPSHGMQRVVGAVLVRQPPRTCAGKIFS
jgi:hypothetical protein